MLTVAVGSLVAVQTFIMYVKTAEVCTFPFLLLLYSNLNLFFLLSWTVAIYPCTFFPDDGNTIDCYARLVSGELVSLAYNKLTVRFVFRTDRTNEAHLRLRTIKAEYFWLVEYYLI